MKPTTEIIANRPGEAIVLQNDRLRVEIAAPGSVYIGARFDWTAFITQITLDGRHTFCAAESIDGTGTGGVGLCSEFGIGAAVGFAGCGAGEQFVKPGVGLLTRGEKERRYDFSREYEIAPFRFTMQAGSEEVSFSAEPVNCRGYALRTTRSVRVEQAELIISNSMENIGEQRVMTDEYCHNFISINGHSPGAGMRLRVPTALRSTKPFIGLQMNEATIEWPDVLSKPFYSVFEGFDGSPPWWWELADVNAGIAISETVDFKPIRFAIYATRRLVSPEVFHGIDLQPGQQCQWRRRFAFRTL